MASTARDFASPEIEALPPPAILPSSPALLGRPATNGTDHDHSHRASIASYSSTGTAGLRNRRMSRNNTVKAYHEDEHDIWQPGAEPGIDAAKEDDDPRLASLREMCDIDIIDYSDSELRSFSADNFTLSAVLEETRPEDLPCRWITVNGLSGDVIKTLANKYKLHRLAVEDLINTRTRTKVDWYSDHAFACLTLQKLVRIHSHGKHDDCDCQYDFDGAVTAYGESHKTRSMFRRKSVQRNDDVLPKYEERPSSAKIKAHSTTSVEAPVKHIRTLHRYEGAHNPEHTAFMEKHSALAEEDLVVSVEQVAIFLMSDNTVITFFEHSGQDVEGPILDRLESPSTMLRRSEDASLLLQAIIDTIVDLAMPVKDAYNKARKDMQIDVLTNPDIGTSKSLYIFSEEIDMLQNLFKPIVHLVNALRDHQADPLNPASIAQQQAIIRGNNRVRPELKSMMSASGTMSGMQGRKPTPRPGVSTTSSAVVITPLAHTYLGDVLDHCITIIQALEQMDASANNLSQLIFNTVGANTNNFMMILALVTVFFSPLTFISGYFGMNFVRFDAINQHSDAFFWVVALPSVAVFMFVVSGNMMWTFFKNMFMKFRIQRIRDKRFRMRRAAMGNLQRKKTKRRGSWNRSELDHVRTANASVDDGFGLKEAGRSETI